MTSVPIVRVLVSLTSSIELHDELGLNPDRTTVRRRDCHLVTESYGGFTSLAIDERFEFIYSRKERLLAFACGILLLST